jgi:Arc/MetJ family transcription regulator
MAERMYDRLMARSTVDVDRELVQRVMRKYDLASEQAAVAHALKLVDEWIQMPPADAISIEEALALQGVGWSGDLDEMRGRLPCQD